MDNYSDIQRFEFFLNKAKAYFDSGDPQSKEAFLKAAEIAEEISLKTKSGYLKKDYLAVARQIRDFVEKTFSAKDPKHQVDLKSRPLQESADLTFYTKESEIGFKDVAGLEEVKQQIRLKVIEPFKNPELANIYKIQPGAKILLYGPPGTGKTFIARAIAGEVNAAFYAVNCQDLISKYMGESSQKLDELFEKAQKNERAVIFFDEFDSVASKRGDGTDGADAEMARFVATFLTKVDGFKKSSSNKMLLLIAATNRPWALDRAMLRGGRFDTHIYVDLPDQKAREFLVGKVLNDIPRDEDVEIRQIALALKGFGGGDIVAICDKIKLVAYMRSLNVGSAQNITKDDCQSVLASSHNMITPSDLEKFERFRDTGSIH